MGDNIDKIFDNYTSQNLFRNKMVLQSNYTPGTIPHREDQIGSVASILAPALRGERVSNLFVYGKTGTGKTLSVKHVCNKIYKKVEEMGTNNLSYLFINCKLKKVSDTEYRILAELISELGGSVPSTGLPTDQVYSRFI